jgi:hypothetical protein
MAKTKSKAKELSRRQMVILLGSGVMFARARSGEGGEVPPPDACQVAKPLTGKTKINSVEHPVLMANPCCADGMTMFFKGFDNTKTGHAHDHLKDFAAALTANKDELLEYCLMVWGINDVDRTALVKTMQERFEMKEYPAK